MKSAPNHNPERNLMVFAEAVFKGRTLDDIAQELKLTRQRVSIIIKQVAERVSRELADEGKTAPTDFNLEAIREAKQEWIDAFNALDDNDE